MGPESIATVAAALLFAAPPHGAAAISPAAAEAQLAAGQRAMNDFDDVQAHGIFEKLLAAQPPLSISAKAYLYLGIIDFNGLDTAAARDEFRHAVEIDPAVELPLNMSPKARMVFAEARRSVSAELAQPEAPVPAAPASAAAPVAAVSAETPAKGSSHALAWTFGAAGVALGGIAAVGLGEILNYDSIASAANASKNAKSSTQVAPALASAQSWQPWSIGLAIAGAALFTTAFFVW